MREIIGFTVLIMILVAMSGSPKDEGRTGMRSDELKRLKERMKNEKDI